MKGENKSCYEIMKRYKDERVNCKTCWHQQTCKMRAENEFDKFDREMKSNKGVYLE